MATESPLAGDVEEQRKRALKEKLTFRNLPLRQKLGVLGFVLLALLPVVLRPPELFKFTYVLYLMMFAVSWDVVSGYTGQLSFGHAFFFALGGYGTAVITTQHNLPIVVGIAGATLLAALGGVIIGVPALRLEGPYLSLLTLIAPLMLYQLFILFSDGLPYLAPNGLGGTGGLTVGAPQIVGLAQNSVVSVESAMIESLGRYYVSFLALIIVVAVCFAVTRSSAGSVLTAIREDEDAVRSAGLNPAKFKIFAFVLSAAIGGFAAAVWMHAGPYAYPNTENLFGPGRIDLSITVIVVTILGGMGTIVGAVAGALLYGVATVAVDWIGYANVSPLPEFLLAMLTLVFMPEGIVLRAIREGRNVLARYRGEVPPDPTASESRPASESIVETYRQELDELLGDDDR